MEDFNVGFTYGLEILGMSESWQCCHDRRCHIDVNRWGVLLGKSQKCENPQVSAGRKLDMTFFFIMRGWGIMG